MTGRAAAGANAMRSPRSEMRDGRFVRQANAFANRITADASSGFPAEAGRYHLYVSFACPWAHRALIVRALLGLEEVISIGVVDPIRDNRGWQFTGGDVEPAAGPQRGTFRDDVNGFGYLAEAYHATDPDYDRRVTVPCVWDRHTRRLISNDFPQIPRDLATEFAALATREVPSLYPADRRAEMDALDALIYDDVNNGVYRAGFATTQGAYEEAVDAVFARLAELDDRLGEQRHLFGEEVSLIDVHLYVTLIRFDAVYHSHFKCSRRRILDHTNLGRYLRDLWSLPAFRETTDLDHIRRHYFGTHAGINPTRIVPVMPDLGLDGVR